MNKEKKIFEQIYSQTNAVWTREEPPQEVVELIENKIIKPCKMLDVACGEGFQAIFFTKKGFDVLGIDLSENAIEYARKNAHKAGVKVRFMVLDIDNLNHLNERFDFIFEWGLLHHLKIQNAWEKYVEAVNSVLNKGGKYLSMCFNDSSLEYKGKGSGYRSSPSGTKIYYSTQKELRELFKPYFKIIDEKLIHISGDKSPDHISNYFLMEKL